MKSSELLRKAQEELKRRGWYRGAFAPRPVVGQPDQDPSALPCCAWGALNAAVCGDPRRWEELTTSTEERPLNYLAEAIPSNALDPDGTRSVPYWNDEVAESVDEILAGLEKAAQLAEKAGD